MAKITHSKIKVDLVVKQIHVGSGPRGVDVYARNLFNHLSSSVGRSQVTLSSYNHLNTKADITHFTFFDPFFLTLWGTKHTTKFVVTVHDLIPLVFPVHFKPGFRGQLKWFLQLQALRRSSAILTDSICSQKDISRLTGISQDKIYVVPLASGHSQSSKKLVKTVLKEYGLPERYLLYVGDINWNKNIPGLINAYAKLSEDIDLVLVGKAFVSSHQTSESQAIQAAIAQSGKSAKIHLLGFIPTHHLSAVYRGCTLYIQPSWYEGFGFPVLEALEQGVPVLSAKTGSLSEVGGDHVHYFDPTDETSFVKSIQTLLSNQSLREKYLESGLKWAETFTWKRVVKETIDVYEKVLG